MLIALTLQYHALLNALFEATILTTIALRFGYFTGAIGHTGINSSVLHGSFKEAFASAKTKKLGNY